MSKMRYMIRILGILAILSIMALPSSAQDYLEGGYVGSYTGDMGKYFTDPIFMMKVGGGTSSSVGSIQAPRPVSPLGSTVGKTTMGRYSSTNTPVAKTFSSAPAAKPATSIPMAKATAGAPMSAIPAGVSGKWILYLSEGKTISLDLYQSGTRLFGRGSITSGSISQLALCSGTASGNSVTLDVLPESGTELYAISFDASRLNVATKYTAFRYGDLNGYGTVNAIKST